MMRWNRLLLSAESISARACILGQKMPFRRCHRGTDEDAFLTICRWFSVVRVLLLLLLLLLLTHLVHDDGLSVQIIIHERKLRVKGVGIVRVVVLSIRVVFHHPLRGIVVGYVLVLVLGGEHLRHERVLLLLLTRISHNNKKIRVRWYINNVLFFFLSRSRVRKMLPGRLSRLSARRLRANSFLG